MPDQSTPDNVQQTPTGTPPEATGGHQGEQEPGWLPARLQRAEEAARKRLLADLGIEDPSKAKQLIADALKRQQDEMTEVQKAQARIAELEPLAQEAKRIKVVLQETVQQRIDALPDDWKDAVPQFSDPAETLRWLDKVAPKLQKPRAPELDAGARGDSVKLPQLTEIEREYARIAGMTDQQYAEFKLKGQRAKGLF